MFYRIIHDAGYSTEEKLIRKHGIYMNILEGIEEIHFAVDRQNMTYRNAMSQDHIQEVRSFTESFKKADDTDKELGADVINAIEKYDYICRES
uniref:Uncharacterized protein n=1 Tax=Caenorhabditis japonica TaxID=281687 RepID=A0A8R1I8I8_CAEJA